MPDIDLCSCCCWLFPVYLLAVFLIAAFSKDQSWLYTRSRGSSGSGPMYYMRDDD